jgi:hypothetical protein
MAEYQGYIAPLAQSQSYSDALQARMDVIRQQQMQNMQLLLDAQNKRDAMTTQQLEKLYSLRTNGWGEKPIEAFAAQRDKFAQKLKDNQYTDQASFLADLSKLADTHALFSSHYETTNPVMRQTQQYVAQPGLYPDKTMKVTENVETLTQKMGLQRNLGISSFSVSDDGSIQYLGADNRPLDISAAMNPATYLPKVEPVFVHPMQLSNEFTTLYQKALENGKTGNAFIADVLPSLTTKVIEDPSLSSSARTYYVSVNGTDTIPSDEKSEGETDEHYYARHYAEAGLATFRNTKKTYAPTSGGGRTSATTASTKQPAIMDVGVRKGEGPSRSYTNLGALGGYGGKPNEQYYQYSFPSVVSKVNLASFLAPEAKAEIGDDLSFDIKTLRFTENGYMVLPNVSIGAKQVGDVYIGADSHVYSEISAALKKEYGYDITQWTNGSVYSVIQGQASGVPQTTQPGAGTVIKFNAIVQ